MKPGRFITLEGLDGAGKSTHLATVRQALGSRGIEYVDTREPGGTPLGEDLRQMLLSRSMHPDTELMLMFAARCEHVRNVISPAIERGTWVLSDRFTDATYAYQGGGRGIAPGRIRVLEDWVQQGLQPDLTLYFDVSPSVGARRMEAGRGQLDRFEEEATAFHERVRSVYLERAAAEPRRFRVIAAEGGLADVTLELNQVLAEFLS